MISFVFFDVGGVIIKDFAKSNKWQELKFDLGLNGETERTFDDVWNDYENKFLFGVDFEVDRMVDIWRKDHGIPLPKNYSIVSDIASRFEKNESIWPVVRKIHEKVPVGLLTNMYPRMFDILLKSNIMPEMKWDIIIDSSIAGFQKPDPRLFAYAEEKIKVKKEEIFFIDNTEKIIDAANAFGWQTYYYDSADFEKSSRKLDEAFEKLSAKSSLESLKHPPEKMYLELLPRRAEIVSIIRDHQLVTFDFLARRFRRVPASTLHYDLQCLIKNGYIVKCGSTRGALYASKDS